MLLSFNSCNDDIIIDGIDKFEKTQGHYELNLNLLPSDDFIERFEYIDIDYHYREQYKTQVSLFATERSLMIATYDQSVYDEAKEYCLQEMQLSDTNMIEYNGYIFIENIELAVEQDRYGKDKMHGYPEWFNMFAYNEELNCLVFIGFYCPDYTSENAQEVSDNWGEFLAEHFSGLYSFAPLGI